MGKAARLPGLRQARPGGSRLTRMSARPPGAGRSSWALRDYWLLLGAFVISSAGDWLYKLALPLLVLKLTGSALQTAVIYSLEYVPYLLFAPVAGVIADRYDRRVLLIRADTAAACVVTVLAVLAWLHQYHLWLIYPAAFALSTITPLYQTSVLGLLPGTVPRERLGWANSRMQASQGALDLAGPLAGVAAVALLGIQWSLGLDAASFALAALAVALIARIPARAAPAGRLTIGRDLAEAMRFVRSCPPLLWGAIVAAGSSLGLSMIEANMIVYLVHVRHQPLAAVGVVFAALGLGSLAGALLTPRLLRVFRPGSLIIGCVLTGGSFTALLAVLPGFLAVAGAWLVVGASTAGFIVTFYTLRHQLVPERLLGRVVVATRLIAFMMVPVAPVIGGAMLAATGEFWPVITVSAAVQIGVALLALCTPLRRVTAPAPEQDPEPTPEPARPDAAAT